LQRYPSRGKIYINGHDVGGKTPDQRSNMRARTTGFFFQTFNLFPALSTEKNVEYPGFKLKEVSAAERRDRVRKCSDIVGLPEFAGHRPNQFSGETTRGNCACLAMQAKIVLADESTANLDHNNGENILRLMKDVNFFHNDPACRSKACAPNTMYYAKHVALENSVMASPRL
jgi:putative ABC transport system ATP-binding protein